MRVQHLNTNKYIPLVSCVSNLFTSWHCLLKPTYSHLSTASSSHGLRMWIFGAHTAVESEFLSYGVWSQAGSRTKNRHLSEFKWAWHRKSRGKWVGPCNHLDTWVRLSSLRALRLLAVESATNAQRPGNEARWGWPC